mgnify:FL=1
MNNYLKEKIAENLIFSNSDINDVKKSLLDISDLMYFKSIVEYLALNKYLSYDRKIRIYSILSELRNTYDDYRGDRLEIINEMIRYLNNQTKDKSDEFYQIEMVKRTNDTEFYNTDIRNYISLIEISLSFDYIVLYSHNSDLLDMESFNRDFLEYFIKEKDLYLYSLNLILNENEEVITEDFKKRANIILSHIKKSETSLLSKFKYREYIKVLKKANKKN